MEVNRRSWLKTAGIAALGVGAAARCARDPSQARSLARVNVSPDRVIRTVVGLRPFRPTGFRLESESLVGKTVVHNYGHGGGGMTMSWGTAHLAMEAVLATGETTAAVLGCGGVGLATARLLQRHGIEVIVYAKDLPPQTTSNVACAQWSPAESADPNRRTPAFMEQFTRAARLSYRYFQDLAGDDYGVRWLENYAISEHPFEDRGSRSSDSPIRDLFPEIEDLLLIGVEY